MLPDLATLMYQCAPNVGTVTMQALIKTESAGHPYILADAGPANLPWRERKNMVRTLRPATAGEAAALVAQLQSQGHIVAIGLTQINAKNLPALGLSVQQVLDPCTNIRAGAKILTDFYASALKKFGTSDPQAALQAALSSYWSGNFVDGFSGGYVQQVINNAGLAVELKIPSLAKGTVLRGPRGTFQVRQAGVVSPYAASLQVAAFNRTAAPAAPAPAAPAQVALERAPLAVAGFNTSESPR